MSLPDEAIKEFIAIYKKQFGVELNMTDGREKAQKLFNLFKVITKPVNDYNKPKI